MNELDLQYLNLVSEILRTGVSKGDRTGVGTLSLFGKQITHDWKQGFPLLTVKKMPINTIATELKWFLKGDTNIKYLVDNGCNIWNRDAYRQYKRACDWDLQEEMSYEDFVQKIKDDEGFALVWGGLGPIYGSQWREWELPESKQGQLDARYGVIDQLHNLIRGIKDNPEGRRHIVSAWNPGDLSIMALPPCHYSFQCYVADGKLSLLWNQRSVDTFLGLPFNIASYGILQLLICKETGLIPDKLIGNLGDTHLYKNHLDQARELQYAKPYQLPKLEISSSDLLKGEFEFELKNYQSNPKIEAPLNT